MNNIVVDKVKLCGEVVIDDLDYNLYEIEKDSIVKINIKNVKYKEYEFNLEENAYLVINKLYNEKEVDENITINLNGLNSRVDYNFSTLTFNNQKYVININHNNKGTISNVINHGVVMNDSELLFEVNSTVKKGNKASKLNQESKIIVMSSNNSIIKPNLFIDEYDVDAVHSATIGKFRKDEIFYLMTKGLTEKDAISLLIKGFLEGHIGR